MWKYDNVTDKTFTIKNSTYKESGIFVYSCI